jgi:AraC family transcriptional regulator, 4-hydroxyphenylacetate 3-monooxygenase operon regulatory protein
MAATPVLAIPDIHIGRAYHRRDPECDVHYETFGTLAQFFGRNTPMHRHNGFFQIHLLVRGGIRLTLDQSVYCGEAPLLFFTPPAVPHSFYSEEDTDGHVLTVRQEVVRDWQKMIPGQFPEALMRSPSFIEFARIGNENKQEFNILIDLINVLQKEFFAAKKARSAALLTLGNYFFIVLARLLQAGAQLPPLHQQRGEDLRLFLKFCDMVEANFRDHLTLTAYADRLSITGARLNDICRRMANLPSKEVVHQRLLQEARRLLRYSAVQVSEIGYQLGFSDPAYFSRFFTKRTGLSPSQFRLLGPA